MAWTKLPGVGQSAQLNINGLVRYNGHWYMLSTDYRYNEFGGSSYDYMLSEVQDLQTMRRVHRGGPWRIIRYPDSTQWIDGNARGGCNLIVYKDKIYFATRDYSASPAIYYTRVWRFDPRNGIGQLQNIHTSAVSGADCYDAWPNDMCIHNDKLFIGCCDRVIRFDGVTWTDLDPFPVSFDERDSNGAYNDFVSLCSFDGKLVLSAATYGRGYPDDYWDEFRIMVSTNDGTNWTDVTVWNENQYSVEYGDQWMACLTSFNGHIYMVTDIEMTNACKIYKLVNGDGSPQLIIEDHTHKYRMYSHLFTTRYDGDTTLYIGSHNSIKSMDVDENITTELSIKPYHPTYFINGYCDNETTGEFVYVGGDIGWVSSVNLINAGLIYYSVAYSKDFSDYPAFGSPPEPTIVIPIPPDIDPGEPPIDPINPPPEVVGAANLSTTFTLKSVSVVTTSVTGEDVSIVVSPEIVSLQLTRYYIVNVSVSINEMDVVSLNATPFNAHEYIVDDYTHHVEVIDSTIDLSPISIVTQMMAGGSTCKAIWNFESGALTVDSKGHNDLTDNYYVVESTSGGGYKRGTCAALFDEAYTQYFQIEDVDLDSNFPLKNGDTVKKISTCCWIKPDIVASPTRRIFAKYNSSDDQCSFGVNIYSSKIRIHWGTGTSATSYTTANPTLVVGRWYHVGVVADGVGKSLFVRIWDDTAQTVYDYTVTPATELYVGSSAVTIAGLPDYLSEQYCYGGVIDELAVFNSLLTSSDIDSIRTNGIDNFGDTQTSISIEQDLVELDTLQYEPGIFTSGEAETSIVANAEFLSTTLTQLEVSRAGELFNGLIINDTISIGGLDYVVVSIGDSVNLFVNPGFEDYENNWWFSWPSWPTPETPPVIDFESTEQVYEGTYSGKVSVAAERDVDFTGIAFTISPVDTGDSFTLSAWVYWESGEAPCLFASYPTGYGEEVVYTSNIASAPCSQMGVWEQLSITYNHTVDSSDWHFNFVAGITAAGVTSVFHIDTAECRNTTNVAYNYITETQLLTVELDGMGIQVGITEDDFLVCQRTTAGRVCTALAASSVSQWGKRISLKELDGNASVIAIPHGTYLFTPSDTALRGINDLGEVVGTTFGFDENSQYHSAMICIGVDYPWLAHAFFGWNPWRDDSVSPLPVGINNYHIKAADGPTQWGYVDAGGEYHDVTAEAYTEFWNYSPQGINDNGVMLGYKTDKYAVSGGYSVNGGCFHTIGTGFSDLPLPPGFTILLTQWDYDPPGFITISDYQPWNLNNDKVVVGSLAYCNEGSDYYQDGYLLYGPAHGFIFDVPNNTVSIVDYPGGLGTNLCAISNNGVIVGYTTIESEMRIFIYDDGDFIDFDLSSMPNSTGATFTPYGINNDRVVVGFYDDALNVRHGWTASPVTAGSTIFTYTSLDVQSNSYDAGGALSLLLEQPALTEQDSVNVSTEVEILGVALASFDVSITALFYGVDICYNTGGTATASTDSDNAVNAIDNDDNTYWRSFFGPTPIWWKFNCGVGITKKVVRLRVYCSVPGYVGTFTFQGSNDDVNWSNLATCAQGQELDKIYTFANSTGYRYYRMYDFSSTSNCFFMTVQMFELIDTEVTDVSTEVDLVSLTSTVNEVTVLEVANESIEADLLSLTSIVNEVEIATSTIVGVGYEEIVEALHDLSVLTSSIVTPVLLSLTSTLYDVDTLLSVTASLNLSSLLIRPLSVRVISPTDIATSTGKSIGIGIEMEM